MGCPNILNIRLSGKTMIWIILIAINFLFLVSYTIKNNPLEEFSSISGENSFYTTFLKKLEYKSADKRNQLINSATPNYLEVNTNHPKFNKIGDNTAAIPSLYTDIKSQPKPLIQHHTKQPDNKVEESHSDQHNFNSRGFLFGFVRHIFPRRHTNYHSKKHHIDHHSKHRRHFRL